ncbi:hypothetical protein GCM10007049_13900 [Echinicola pacifica]|uniref:Outer membrane protein beta-barrel domain-containing protein n=1 Tax=Echinicola pacifica TaxID=346377 RepID=A0A918UN23_9BACT|nr:outer membrane beta-barrel protein [Echinicola pacifica]GGZ22327.1 hypothetical protein GCM10007049_13900 [Echinicola pacifica]
MKKLLLLGLFAFTVSFAQAQSPGDIRLSAGADYAFDLETFGLNFGGEYLFTDKISTAPNFTIYFPDGYNSSTLNVDFRYYFTEDILQWYGLLGFTNNWVTFDALGVKSTGSAAGANIGAGGVLKFTDNLAFNPELKYQAMDNGQFVLKFGVVYFLR